MQELRVQALQLLGIEAGGRARDLPEIEQLRQRFKAFLRMQRLRRADQRGVRHHRQRLKALLAHARDRQRAEPLGQRFALRAGEQIVMRENGHGRAQRLENLDLHRCVGHVILAADDVGDAHIRVVGHAREGVERRAVLADQHGIGDGRRVDLLRAANEVVPGRAPVFEQEAPMRFAARRLQFLLLLLRELQRGAVVDRGLPRAICRLRRRSSSSAVS